MTDNAMEITEQLKDNLADGWILKSVEKLHISEHTLGHYRATFYNSNLDITCKLYITLTSNGWVYNLFKLKDLLKEATRTKCEEFVRALT